MSFKMDGNEYREELFLCSSREESSRSKYFETQQMGFMHFRTQTQGTGISTQIISTYIIQGRLTTYVPKMRHIIRGGK
jgi:hypothetical protein